MITLIASECTLPEVRPSQKGSGFITDLTSQTDLQSINSL